MEKMSKWRNITAITTTKFRQAKNGCTLYNILLERKDGTASLLTLSYSTPRTAATKSCNNRKLVITIPDEYEFGCTSIPTEKALNRVFDALNDIEGE